MVDKRLLSRSTAHRRSRFVLSNWGASNLPPIQQPDHLLRCRHSVATRNRPGDRSGNLCNAWAIEWGVVRYLRGLIALPTIPLHAEHLPDDQNGDIKRRAVALPIGPLRRNIIKRPFAFDPRLAAAFNACADQLADNIS